MKGKQLAVLLILVAVLGGVYFLMAGRRDAAWAENGRVGGKVLQFPLNDVARVLIKSPTGEVNLVKKADAWTVTERADYPASFDLVSGLLRKLWDLKTVQEVKVGASQMSRLELVEPGKGDKSGTLVQLDAAEGKTLAALLVGKQFKRQAGGDEGAMGGGGFPAGRYVKPTARAAEVSLISDPLNDVSAAPEHWLAKDFIKIEGPKAVTVSGADDPHKWKATRDDEKGEWKLVDQKSDEKLDPSKTAALGNVLAAPTFNDVQAPEAKLDGPTTTAGIDTFAGFHYELTIGKELNGNFPMTVKVSANLPKERTAGKDEKPEDKTRLDAEFTAKLQKDQEKLAKEKKMEGRIFVVPRFALDIFLKGRAELLAPKPTPTPAPSPAAATPPISVTTPPIAAPKQR